MVKILDYTIQTGQIGKWVEVGYFCKVNDPHESLTVVAKFISLQDARKFAEIYQKLNAGATEIIIR